ncbi:hypothetical protein EBU94_02450, partial [bacterium]|nr:hypothetical protein [bacterium]
MTQDSVKSAIKKLMDKDKQLYAQTDEETPELNLLEKGLIAAQPILEPVGKVLGYPGGLVRGAIAGAIEKATGRDDLVNLKDVLKGEAPFSSEIMEKMGVKEGKSLSDVLPSLYSKTGNEWTKLQKGGLLDPTARGAAGLATDIITDPLTYATAGTVRAVSKNPELTKQALQDFLEKMAEERGSLDLGKKVKLPKDITLSDLTEVLPGIFSQAEKTVLQEMPERASPQQIYGIVQKMDKQGIASSAFPMQRTGFLSGKVKPEEIKYLKIPEFLEGKTTVTKDELLSHIRRNLPNLDVVDFGSKYSTHTVHPLEGKYAYKGLQWNPLIPEEVSQKLMEDLKGYDPKLKEILEQSKITKMEEIRKDPEIKNAILDILEKRHTDLLRDRKLEGLKLLKDKYGIEDAYSKSEYRNFLANEDAALKFFQRLIKEDAPHYGSSPNIVGHFRRKLVNQPLLEDSKILEIQKKIDAKEQEIINLKNYASDAMEYQEDPVAFKRQINDEISKKTDEQLELQSQIEQLYDVSDISGPSYIMD